MILDLQATPAEVMRAVEALREFALARGLTEQSIFGLTVALEECGSNIVNHGLKAHAGARFQLSADIKDNLLIMELRDPGPPFDPTQAMPRPTDDEAVGGGGLQLVTRYVDKIQYERQGGENVLRLFKRFPNVTLSNPANPSHKPTN